VLVPAMKAVVRATSRSTRPTRTPMSSTPGRVLHRPQAGNGTHSPRLTTRRHGLPARQPVIAWATASPRRPPTADRALPPGPPRPDQLVPSAVQLRASTRRRPLTTAARASITASRWWRRSCPRRRRHQAAATRRPGRPPPTAGATTGRPLAAASWMGAQVAAAVTRPGWRRCGPAGRRMLPRTPRWHQLRSRGSAAAAHDDWRTPAVRHPGRRPLPNSHDVPG
jgi:hypothetical protein